MYVHYRSRQTINHKALNCAPLLKYFIVIVICITVSFYICSFYLMSWWNIHKDGRWHYLHSDGQGVRYLVKKQTNKLNFFARTHRHSHTQIIPFNTRDRVSSLIHICMWQLWFGCVVHIGSENRYKCFFTLPFFSDIEISENPHL